MAPAASPDKPTRAVFVHCPQLEQYHYPADCPLSAERAGKLYQTLGAMSMLTGAGRRVAAPRPADTETLPAFHTRRYLDAPRSAQDGHLGVEALQMGLGTEDCPVFAGLYDYAVLAAGASVTAAALIAEGQAGSGPGHRPDHRKGQEMRLSLPWAVSASAAQGLRPPTGDAGPGRSTPSAADLHIRKDDLPS